MRERIRSIVGVEVTDVSALGGGCIADVSLLRFVDGSRLVAKAAVDGGLAIEGWMLTYLADNSGLPVPHVEYQSDDLLLLEYVENDGSAPGEGAQTHAAELLAELHEISAEEFGLDRDTVIGGLCQPNGSNTRWLDFFAEQRLLAMGARAQASGVLPDGAYDRIETLCGRLHRWLLEPARPSLIHGDMWGGNILVKDGRIAGFVDPAIYYADAEIELAFATLFSTFGDTFFSRYADLRLLEADFFEVRAPIYNVYPLLVHAVLFGGGYGRQLDATLKRFVD
jgi:fructosamine-3-kinase